MLVPLSELIVLIQLCIGIVRDTKGQVDTRFVGYDDLSTMTDIVKLVPPFWIPLVVRPPDGQGLSRQQLALFGKASWPEACTRCHQVSEILKRAISWNSALYLQVCTDEHEM